MTRRKAARGGVEEVDAVDAVDGLTSTPPPPPPCFWSPSSCSSWR